MNCSKSLLAKTVSLVPILGITVFMTGCSIKAARTVGLPGLTPLASADQVKLVEKIEEVRQPYQIVGQVRLIRSNGALYEGESYKRMKQIAAGMGADGLIGLHLGGSEVQGTLFRSGLAVKWLAPGEAKRGIVVPFLVTVLPVQDQTAHDKGNKISEWLRGSVLYQLETKGYYVLPVQPDDFNGGIEKARELSDTELHAVGGEDAQLLLCLTIETHVNTDLVITVSSNYSIRTTMLDKQSRNTVFERVGTGSFSVGRILYAAAPDAKSHLNGSAAGVALQSALTNLPAIHEEMHD